MAWKHGPSGKLFESMYVFSFFFAFWVLKEVHVSKRAFRRVQGNVPCKNVNCQDMHLKVINETKRLIAIIQRRLLCMDMRFKPFIPEISRSNLQFKRFQSNTSF